MRILDDCKRVERYSKSAVKTNKYEGGHEEQVPQNPTSSVRVDVLFRNSNRPSRLALLLLLPGLSCSWQEKVAQLRWLVAGRNTIHIPAAWFIVLPYPLNLRSQFPASFRILPINHFSCHFADMRYIAPALLSLAALVAAQSSDCVSSYETCLLSKDEPACNSELATVRYTRHHRGRNGSNNIKKCKDSCAKDLDTCNQSGKDSTTCQTGYNSCLNTFPIIPGGSDCVSKFIK